MDAARSARTRYGWQSHAASSSDASAARDQVLEVISVSLFLETDPFASGELEGPFPAARSPQLCAPLYADRLRPEMSIWTKLSQAGPAGQRVQMSLIVLFIF